VNLRQTKSQNFYEQLIGRGTRKSENTLKNELMVLDFLWQYAEVGLVRPAFVLTNNDEHRAAMGKELEASKVPINLVELRDKVERDIYAGLQEKLKENAKKKKRLISISEMVEDVPELLNYYPRDFPYGPSSAQLAVLERHGVDIDGVIDKKHASMLIDWLHERIETGKASQKQLALLRRLGIKSDLTTTFERASMLIDQRLGSTKKLQTI
jgi:hypothetical protein